MNRKRPSLNTLKKTTLVLLALFGVFTPIFSQNDTICSDADRIGAFQMTLVSDTSRWHYFRPPSDGTIQISTCNLGFTEYHVFDACVDDTARVAIDSLSITSCNNGEIETYPASAHDTLYIEVLDGEGLNDNKVLFEYIPDQICPGNTTIPLVCNVPFDTFTINGVSNFNSIYYSDCIEGTPSTYDYNGADHVYEVQIEQAENIYFKLSNLSTNLDFFLFDDLCNSSIINCMASNTTEDTNEKTIGPLTLPTGTYYIIVDGADIMTEGSYTIEASCPDCTYVGPDFDAGRKVLCNAATFDSTLLNNNAFNFSDYSCYDGSKIYNGQDNLYFVDIPVTSSFVTFSINNLEHDYDIFAFDGNFDCIDSSTNDGTEAETIILQNTFGRYYFVVDSEDCGINSEFTILVSCDCDLNVNISIGDDQICENEVTTITAVATTGSGPYNFTWSDMTQEENINGSSTIDASTGTHCVTVSDNFNCGRVRCITVEDNGTPFINDFNVTPASCFQSNGEIEVEVTGNFALDDTIKYSLDSIVFQTENVFTGLAPGPYTVYVTNTNGCSNLDETIVEDLPPPTITNVETTLDSCRIGIGSLTIIANTPNGGLQYSIDGESFQSSNTFNNLTANTYSVSIIDNSNCIITQTVEVMSTPAPQIDNIIIAADTCGINSGRIEVQTSGGTGTVLYSINNTDFQTSPVFDFLSGGNYTVYVTDNNDCPLNTEVIIPTLGAPEVSEMVRDTGACAGSSASFSVGATLSGEGTITYQWQILNNGNWTNINNPNIYSGEQTETLVINDVTGLDGRQFRVSLSSEFCTQAIVSNTATLRVDGALFLTQGPIDQGLCSGQGTIFTTFANSESSQPILYQWELSTNSGVNWTNLSNGGLYSGSNTDTLRISNASNLNNFMYRVSIFTDFCESITSEPALLQIERPMSVTAQPNNFNVCSGENVSFSFTINSNGFDNPLFQWQESGNGGDSWSNISDNEVYVGTTTTTLSINNVDGLNNYLYRSAVIGGFCDTLFTNPALLRVTGQVAISSQPINVTTCTDESAIFSFSTGDSGTDESFDISWEVSDNNGETYVPIMDNAIYSGSDSTILSISNVNGLDNYRYRAKLLSDDCEPSVSQSATLNVENPILIDLQPSSTIICSGQSASFSVQIDNSNNSSEVNYIWQINTDGTTWTNLTNDNVYNGVNSPNLSISNTFGLNNAQFRILVGNEACPITTSEAASLTTQGPIDFGNQPQNVAACNDGSSVSFSAVAINQGAGEIVYQWEISDDATGFITLSDNEIYSGTDGTTLIISDITGLNNKRFRLSAGLALCPTIYSTPASLVIEGPVTIATEAQDVISCAGETVTFNIEASSGVGGALAYQWQINTGEGWSNIQNSAVYNGATTNTLSIANTNNLSGSQFRAIVVTQFCTTAVVSEEVNLMVQGEVNITEHPQNNILCANENTSFSTIVNTTGETNLQYQWQISTNNGMDWIDLTNQSPYSDVQTTTLNISSVNGLNGNQYRTKIFSEFCDELYTNPATLTVEGPISILSQPINIVACSGNSATFQIEANNAGVGNLSYQWYISTDNGENYFDISDANFNYNGTNSPTLNIVNTANLNGAMFVVEVSSPSCPIMTSQMARLSVEGPINILTHPTDQAACNDGVPIVFSASVENQNSGTLSYQWEASEDGTTFNTIADNTNYSGSNSPTLTIQNAGMLNGFQYRLVAQTPACNSLTTNAATLAVNSPSIQNISILEDTCSLGNGSIMILADGGFGDLLYSLDDDNYQTSNSFSNLAGTDYMVFVQDENGCTASESVMVPTFGAPDITDIQIVPDTCGRNVGSISISAQGNTDNLLYSIDGTNFQTQNVFENLSADTYTVFVKDGFDCAAQMTATLSEVGGMLSLNLNLEEDSGSNPNDGIICAAEDVTLTASANGGNDEYIYTWNNDLEDGAIQMLNPMNNVTYVVTATDGNFCFAIDSVSIIVQESPIASTNSNSPVCEGEAIIFSAAGGSVYEWTGPNNFSSNAPNPTIPVSTGQDAGTYTLTINNQNNCPNTASLEVEVIGATNYPATVSVTDDFICEGDDDEIARLMGNLYPEIDARGIWFTNSTGVDIDGVVSANATATGLNYGPNTFIWALSNETCDEFATDSVTVFLEPLPIAKNDSLTSFENVPIDSISVILNDNVDQLVEWEIDLVKQPDRAEVTYLGNGSFSVKPEETFFGELRFSYRLVSISCNRFVEAEVIINIKDNNEAVHCLWTPQVDGPNWEICRGISPNNTIRIIDRYGKLVFSASPYLNNWDGTNIETGQPVPTGTYYFILTQDKETESDDEILGTLVLLR